MANSVPSWPDWVRRSFAQDIIDKMVLLDNKLQTSCHKDYKLGGINNNEEKTITFYTITPIEYLNMVKFVVGKKSCKGLHGDRIMHNNTIEHYPQGSEFASVDFYSNGVISVNRKEEIVYKSKNHKSPEINKWDQKERERLYIETFIVLKHMVYSVIRNDE